MEDINQEVVEKEEKKERIIKSKQIEVYIRGDIINYDHFIEIHQENSLIMSIRRNWVTIPSNFKLSTLELIKEQIELAIERYKQHHHIENDVNIKLLDDGTVDYAFSSPTNFS